MDFNERINKIKGIGDKTESLFQKIDVFTISDLIEHYPKGYDVYEKIIPIVDVLEGKIVAIEATVCKSIEIKKINKLQIVSCIVKDTTDTINLKWFNMPFLKNTLRIGYKFIFRGKVVQKNGVLIMEQPQIISNEEYQTKISVLQPVYPLTSGLTNNIILKSIKQIFFQFDILKDFLPEDIKRKYELIDYHEAIHEIHFPKNTESMVKARKRVVFDEFFLFTIALNKLKEKKEKQESKFLFQNVKECENLIDQLPYTLTKAQLLVWNEIKNDFSNKKIMNRLVQGDVGSGKTIIAALALLMTAINGYQGSIMVPTEVLAKQHFESLTDLYKPFGIRVNLLVGSMSAKEKRNTYELIKSHQTDIIVGTHALIQEKVKYANLALVITDEQHRFGVRQREAFASKGEEPHILVMSATPIPRTLAIMVYGDLDISVIDELPANRLPIKNCVVNTGYRATATKFIEKEVLNGRQAYIICPMVEESETIEAENVIEYTEKIKDSLLPLINVEYLHGKMKPKEKNDIMERFAANEIHVLVSTTVVEVGVNVPNATVMMIENAERFGLAQLHQLRGRVGRGKHQSYCILVSGSNGKEVKERLEILNKSNDGFFIASEDLKLRGPGDMFGIRQSGIMEFKMADIFTDASILKQANDAAKLMTDDDIESICKQSEIFKQKIEKYSGNVLI